jgi:hypothetical protein
MNGKKLRDEGIEKASRNHGVWLAKARGIALDIAKRQKRVTINEVRKKIKLPKTASPNLWGAVMRDKRLIPVGYCQAKHPAAHSRIVRIYTTGNHHVK